MSKYKTANLYLIIFRDYIKWQKVEKALVMKLV